MGPKEQSPPSSPDAHRIDAKLFPPTASFPPQQARPKPSSSQPRPESPPQHVRSAPVVRVRAVRSLAFNPHVTMTRSNAAALAHQRRRTALLCAIAAVSTALVVCIIGLGVYAFRSQGATEVASSTQIQLSDGAKAANDAARAGLAVGDFNSVWAGNEATSAELAVIIRDAFVIEYLRTGHTTLDFRIAVAETQTEENIRCTDDSHFVACVSESGHAVYIA